MKMDKMDKLTKWTNGQNGEFSSGTSNSQIQIAIVRLVKAKIMICTC